MRAWAEGHPVPRGRLARATEIQPSCIAFSAVLAGYGVHLSPNPEVTRFDVAATIRFEDPAIGLAVLATVGLLPVPRCKPEIHGNPPETVYYKALKSQRKFSRIYDWGISREIGERGRWLRFEAQQRCAVGKRRTSDAMSSGLLRETFENRFAPICRASKGVFCGAFVRACLRASQAGSSGGNDSSVGRTNRGVHAVGNSRGKPSSSANAGAADERTCNQRIGSPRICAGGRSG
jgi:hypothetical protein